MQGKLKLVLPADVSTYTITFTTDIVLTEIVVHTILSVLYLYCDLL